MSSAADPAVVHPEKDGTTYITVGSAGRPPYAWSGAVEADRNFLAGVNTGKAGNGTVVPADAKTGVGPYASQADFTDAYETVDWSQARYRDYAGRRVRPGRLPPQGPRPALISKYPLSHWSRPGRGQ